MCTSAFFSGNEVFWKTRWENSIAAGATPYRTLVSYKETHANAKIDPLTAYLDGNVAGPAVQPAGGWRPARERAERHHLHGELRARRAIKVPAAEGKLRFWRNTDVAALAPADVATLPDGTLGYEWDEDRDNGSRPPG